jgi:ATP-dependent Clp protease ATP-binding subunit ClpC
MNGSDAFVACDASVLLERFTNSAREAVVQANEAAHEFQHQYVGSEHLLLGLIREKRGPCAHVLESLGVTADGVSDRIVQMVGRGDEPTTAGAIPFTPEAKNALEEALREAQNLGQDHIDTEHLLLGLVREQGGAAARILLAFGADSERIRNEVIRFHSAPGPGGMSPP